MAKRKNPHAVALGRRGGRATSPAKTAAVRRNGLLGGRKPKFKPDDRAAVNDRAPRDYVGRLGTIANVRPGEARYLVAFDDGREPTAAVLRSWWLQSKR
jgi:hypothetical protein